MPLEAQIHYQNIVPEIWLDADSKNRVFNDPDDIVRSSELPPNIGITKNLVDAVSLGESIKVAVIYARSFAEPPITLTEKIKQSRQFNVDNLSSSYVVNTTEDFQANLAKVTSYNDTQTVGDLAPTMGLASSLMGAAMFNVVPLN